MLRISTRDTRFQRRLVLEGRLVEPWLSELQAVCRKASEALEGRKLIVDLTNVTVISHDGESALLELMQEGVKFYCGGVLIKHVVKKLARNCRGSLQAQRQLARSDD